MKTKGFRLKVIIYIILLLVLLSSLTVMASPLKKAITVTGEGLILNYTEENYFTEEQFNYEYKKYCKNKSQYLADFVENFSSTFLTSSLQAYDWFISFESRYSMRTRETKCLILIKCKVEGAGTGQIDKPYFRTEWLLIPLLGKSIDLYQFNYQKDEIVAYHGKVKGIPITITFKFLKPINHCHYHIWYR
jgi:hypothetical protein